jgi:hypothetical protein
VRGGTPKDTELTAREREICAAIGPALRQRGLIFVGIDVIDGFLTEINVTSPTGIRAIKNLGGPDVAAMIWDRIEDKRAGRRRRKSASGKQATTQKAGDTDGPARTRDKSGKPVSPRR